MVWRAFRLALTERRGDTYGGQPSVTVDLHGHTAIKTSRSAAALAISGRSLPAVSPPETGRHLFKAGPVQHRTLAPDGLRADLQNTVQQDFAGPALLVPAAGAQIHILRGRRTGGNPVLAGQHQPQKIRAIVAHQQHRPVLPLTVILFVRDPGPHHLARIRVSVRLGSVADGDAAAVITGIGGSLGGHAEAAGRGAAAAWMLFRGGRLGRGPVLQHAQAAADGVAQRTQIHCHPDSLSAEWRHRVLWTSRQDAEAGSGTWDTGSSRCAAGPRAPFGVPGGGLQKSQQ